MTRPRQAAGEVARTRWAAVVVLALGTLIVASEMTMAALALPLIGADLQVGQAATAWVLLAYSVPLAALAMPMGRWAGGADLRLVFVLGLAGVGAASVLGALAPTFEALIASRVLQGIAAALFLSVNMPILARVVRRDQRGRALSYLMTVMTLGSMAAAPLGGYVATAFGWREVLLVKFPLLLVVLALGYWTITAQRPQAGRLPSVDRTLWLDVLGIGAAMTALLFALDLVKGQWAGAVALLAAAAALAVWWVRLPGSRPVVALVRRRIPGLPVLAMVLVSTAMGLLAFLLPYFIAEVLGRSPALLGVATLFFAGAAGLIAPLAGSLADRYGPMPVAAAGAAVSAAAVLAHATLGPDAGLAEIGWRLALLGAGFGLASPAVTTAILNGTPDEMAGTAGGLTNTARTLGTTLGPALSALAWGLAGGGTAGFVAGVAVLAAIMLGAVAALLAGGRCRQAPGPDHPGSDEHDKARIATAGQTGGANPCH